ncbi:hypothetical protein HZQ56_17745 [Elizabethkingia anophelis]|nr:hypothetical protein [Elizabethkingia anophelis]MCT3875022.1 hypothetical protein [Elizabethkingia anophelis]
MSYLKAMQSYSILVEEELNKSSGGGVGATSKKRKGKNDQELSIKAKLLFK